MICPNCKKENMNEYATVCAYCNQPLYSSDVAEAKAVELSAKQKKDAAVIQASDMTLDTDSKRLHIKDQEINLTSKEFDVLELLVKNPDKVYSREKLLQLVWGSQYPGDVRTVDVHIRRLREKIEVNPSDPKYVHTKWGVGYYFKG